MKHGEDNQYLDTHLLSQLYPFGKASKLQNIAEVSNFIFGAK